MDYFIQNRNQIFQDFRCACSLQGFNRDKDYLQVENTMISWLDTAIFVVNN